MTVRMERLRVLRDAGTAHNLGIRRYLPSLLLAGYGAFILSLYFRGVMTWYINPTYVAPATLAAVVLLFIAAVGARPRAAGMCRASSLLRVPSDTPTEFTQTAH